MNTIKEKEDDILAKYGVVVQDVGNRHRGWWVVDKVGAEELDAGGELGDLCVKSRDGGSNPMCIDSLQRCNFVGTSEDAFDCTYRYYYYRALT